jgi:hypothetical protein
MLPSGAGFGISDGNNVDVQSSRRRERLEIIGIGGQYEIPVCRKEHKGGIDDVGRSTAPQQHSGTPAKRIIERLDLERR